MHVLAGLPESIDTDVLQKVIIGMMVVLGVLVFFVIRTVQKLWLRAVFILALIGVGVGLWVQREQLQDCTNECECRVFGQDVRVPDVGQSRPCF